MPNDPSQPLSHPESPAVATRVVVFTAVGFLAFVGITLVLLRIYYGEEIRQSVFVPPKAFAEPQLQTDDAADLAKLQSEQWRRLSGYGWVDRDKGIIRIPIEDAMKWVAARGANAYAPVDPIAASGHPKDGGGDKPQ
jgi:hypothetical protein